MIEIVIARYNEDLEWLLNKKFLNYKIIVYNKGKNNNYIKLPNMKSININNVGRCDHTYLYHIIKNYNNLANITIFLPGSCDIHYKIYKMNLLLKKINETNSAVFLYENKLNNVQLELYNFEIKSYVASYIKNKLENPELILELSHIRPYGKWYASKFNNIIINHVSYYGIFSIAKQDIIYHTKFYYENLIKELNNSSNPEVGHYFERSWEAVFYPMNNTIKIPYTDIRNYYINLIIKIIIIVLLIIIIIYRNRIAKFIGLNNLITI